MSTIEKAKTSVDSGEIKKGRTTAKRNFTTAVKLVKTSLETDVSETDEGGVKEAFESVKEKYDLARELHDRFTEYREEDSDTDKEASNVKEDDDWAIELYKE